MTRTSAEVVTRGHFIAGVVHRAIQADAELTLTGLGHRLGWPEETLRSYREGDSSPTYDRCVHACRKATTPKAVVLDLAQTLVGPRAIVCLVNNQGVPPNCRPSDLVKKTIQMLAGFDALLQDVYERCGDGEVSAEDAASFAKGWAELRGVGEQMVRLSQHCAAQAARR